MAQGRLPLEHEAALRDAANDERVQVRRRRVAAQLHAELRIRAIKRLVE